MNGWSAQAREIVDLLRPHMMVFYDESGAIGRRYRRQDEAGTPFGVTVDFDTIGENGPANEGTVTIRERDSMKQQRIGIGEIKSFLIEKISLNRCGGIRDRYPSSREPPPCGLFLTTDTGNSLSDRTVCKSGQDKV